MSANPVVLEVYLKAGGNLKNTRRWLFVLLRNGLPPVD
jgi:hypothetical protein